MRTRMSRQLDRNSEILLYHAGQDPAGLKCPLCGLWSPIDFDSPLGVRLTCRFCGTVAVMPRVPLIRAIRKRTAT